MSERVAFSVKVDDEVADKFRGYVKETKGKIRGELGREVENALIEYMDNDRYDRIESKQDETHDKLDRLLAALGDDGDTHTHTADVSPTTVSEKRDVIAARLKQHDTPVLSERVVIEAIEEVGGGDERTVRKYKDALRRSGEVFDHPSSDSSAWTTDPEQFATWALAEYESRPDASIADILEPYAMDPNEYERILDDAARASGVNA